MSVPNMQATTSADVPTTVKAQYWSGKKKKKAKRPRV